MKRMKAPGPHPVVDRVTGQAELEQLRSSDEASLLSGEARDPS